MIIYDFDIVRIAITPYKADAPLVVDANAVLPCPITPKRLKTVARRRCQITEFSRDIQLAQLSLCHSLKPSKPCHPLP